MSVGVGLSAAAVVPTEVGATSTPHVIGVARCSGWVVRTADVTNTGTKAAALVGTIVRRPGL
jgi:hypothetical protein